VDKLFQSLGLRIRELRTARGWSQERFAEICGVHRTYMGHLERGEKNASLGSVARVARALEITLSELLSGVDVPASPVDSGDSQENHGTKQQSRHVRVPDAARLLQELQLERETLRETVFALKEVALSRPARSKETKETLDRPRNKHHSSATPKMKKSDPSSDQHG
jgi:transcriptional regulator with XRE-family HTH domain